MSVVSKSFPYGPHTVTIETGEIARQADGAVRVSMGDTVVLVTAVRQADRHSRAGFLPAHRQLHREDLRRGPHPRRLLQARRTSDREGDAHLASHRPPDPAAVSRRLLQRRAGGRDRAVAGSGDRCRTFPSLLGASAALALSGIPFNGPIGAARVGWQGRALPAEPDRQGAHAIAAAPGGRRYRARRADGRVRSQGPLRGGDARRRGVRPRADADRHPRHHASWSPRPASRAGPGSRPRRMPS